MALHVADRLTDGHGTFRYGGVLPGCRCLLDRGGIEGDREQERADFVMQVAGEIGALLFLQRDKLFMQAAVLGLCRAQSRHHRVEAKRQPRQLRRAGVGQPDCILAHPDRREGCRYTLQGTQGAAHNQADQHDAQPAEQGQNGKAVPELGPDLADLVQRLGL